MKEVEKQYYLAADFGASGGRHILAVRDGDRIRMQEVYRFSNSPVIRDHMMCWDIEYLTMQLVEGMKRCRDAGKIPACMGIDTWGLDYVFLDREGRILGNAANHRDRRTRGIYRSIWDNVSEQELYKRTGIQMAEFNTLCQLAADGRDRPELLRQAGCMLMIPDYFGYYLTGRRAQEYTNASTSQLLDPKKRDWDRELAVKLGIPDRLLLPVRMPGERLGRLRDELKEKVGFDCNVILPATHDTASALMVLPECGKGKTRAVISSGTWSLMGMITEEPVISEAGRSLKFTNEGGFGGKNLLLKNSMGLWMIQNIRKETAPGMSFETLCAEAERAEIASFVDCNSDEFLAPESMVKAVTGFCERTGQQIPETPGELAAVVYRSLAKSYAAIREELETVTGEACTEIRIVGGGSNAGYLNQLTADYAGVPVLAGPAEATAAGNIMAQMTADGIFKDLEEAQECAASSFEIKKYLPRERPEA